MRNLSKNVIWDLGLNWQFRGNTSEILPKNGFWMRGQGITYKESEKKPSRVNEVQRFLRDGGLRRVKASLELGESMPCEVHGDDEEHLGCDVQINAIQSILRI